MTENGELIEQHLTDSRADNARFSFLDLLRQSVYSRLAGYEDVNDAERLSQDPPFRLIGSEKLWDRGAALTSRLQTFETETFLYQAESWKTARQVVGKVEHHAGELFPRIGFIVTNLTLPSRAVVRFYNRRGTAEQWMKEGKHAVKMTRLMGKRPLVSLAMEGSVAQVQRAAGRK